MLNLKKLVLVLQNLTQNSYTYFSRNLQYLWFSTRAEHFDDNSAKERFWKKRKLYSESSRNALLDRLSKEEKENPLQVCPRCILRCEEDRHFTSTSRFLRGWLRWGSWYCVACCHSSTLFSINSVVFIGRISETVKHHSCRWTSVGTIETVVSTCAVLTRQRNL